MRCTDGPSEYLFDSGTSGTYTQCNYFQAGKTGGSKTVPFFLAVFGIYHLITTFFKGGRKKIYIYDLIGESCQTWIVLEVI